jgi:hypothetical protein
VDEKSIEDWCNYFKLHNITSIDENDFINIDEHVFLDKYNLVNIPVKFGIVSGHFCCRDNKLISLEGCPIKVGISFTCSYNNLTSLVGGPLEVYRNYSCVDNKLDSLYWIAKIIGGSVRCMDNPIYNEFKKFNNLEHYMRHLKLKNIL